jgi:hypothetical protein
MLSHAQIVSYDTTEYPFAWVLECMVFKVRPLHELHQHWRRHKARIDGNSEIGYSDNLGLRKMMQDVPEDSLFLRLYHKFVRSVLAPLYGGKISYSSRPKMRVHLAGTGGVSKWHRDVDVTHRPDQVNAFLPFTPCFDSCALWCESEYGKGDYRPISLEYGQLLLFDGGYLEHGTVPNTTDSTRVSLDFRFAPLNDQVEPPWSEILAGRIEAGLAVQRQNSPAREIRQLRGARSAWCSSCS